MIAQNAHVARAAKEGLEWPKRRGGRWSGKFVTLTAPHRGDVRMRIAQMTTAFPRFMRKLRARVFANVRKLHMRRGRARDRAAGAQATRIAKKLIQHFAYLRNYEWTSGADNLGHPHVHFWVYCPFLDMNEVRELWRSALNDAAKAAPERAALTLSEEEPLIVDVGSTYGNFAQELMKYMTKDVADVGGGLVDPEVYAIVYESFDGVRVIQGSRGLMSMADEGRTGVRCKCCGTEGHFRVYFLRVVGVADLSLSTESARIARYAKIAGRPPPPPRVFENALRAFGGIATGTLVRQI